MWYQMSLRVGSMGDLELGSTYLSMKSCKSSSESLKSDDLLSLACLYTLEQVSLKSSCHQMLFLTSKNRRLCTWVIKHVLVLFNKFLRSEVAILIEKIHF